MRKKTSLKKETKEDICFVVILSKIIIKKILVGK